MFSCKFVDSRVHYFLSLLGKISYYDLLCLLHNKVVHLCLYLSVVSLGNWFFHKTSLTWMWVPFTEGSFVEISIPYLMLLWYMTLNNYFVCRCFSRNKSTSTLCVVLAGINLHQVKEKDEQTPNVGKMEPCLVMGWETGRLLICQNWAQACGQKCINLRAVILLKLLHPSCKLK